MRTMVACQKCGVGLAQPSLQGRTRRPSVLCKPGDVAWLDSMPIGFPGSGEPVPHGQCRRPWAGQISGVM